jgi:hypothetical protein
MKTQSRIFRNFVLPLAILAPLLFLLVGCIYVPWFETRRNAAQVDFRPMLGDARSRKPIRPGAITRSQIEGLLGSPPYVSIDGRAIGYELRTITAVWVYPLCFVADHANVRDHVVKFTFNSAGQLLRYEVATNDAFCPWFAQGEAELEVGNKPLHDLNRFGPKLNMAGVLRYMDSTQPAASKP